VEFRWYEINSLSANTLQFISHWTSYVVKSVHIPWVGTMTTNIPLAIYESGIRVLQWSLALWPTKVGRTANLTVEMLRHIAVTTAVGR
jgi:hypothetical protein